MRRFFAPEVVQTSSMDCGPASLKCLLDGFGRPVSYERLREACQTGVDGTSIDTMEAVANQLGFEAEQIMVPADHLLLSSSQAFPAVVVTTLPGGLTHFVVLWRRHGRVVQIMDPAVGRRWAPRAQFEREVYAHAMAVDAVAWREFAAAEDFQAALSERLEHIGVSPSDGKRVLGEALRDATWQGLAILDAATRLVTALVEAGGLRGSRECFRFLERASKNPSLIPVRYWSVRAATPEVDGTERLVMRGAVLVRIRGQKAAVQKESMPPSLGALLDRPVLRPGQQLWKLLSASGASASAMLVFALTVAAGTVVFEAVLFRGLFDFASQLALAGQRMGAMAAILLFSLAVLILEIPIFSATVRLGRQMENRLRVAFLAKIPKLGDRYFQSRLISDMAERSHVTHRLRHLPDLVRQLSRAIFELSITAAAIIWLEPSAAMIVLVAVIAAVLPAFVSQPLLIERDLRVRSHAAGLMRFYLDAMLGLVAIRSHGAEGNVRREHEKLLGEWAHAALRLQRSVVSIEAIQLTATFGTVAFLLLAHPLVGANVGRTLLLVYWALNLPVLGQEIGALARQYPVYRNVTLRLLDPLGAPEEDTAKSSGAFITSPPRIRFDNVRAEAAGHEILDDINLEIEPGSHIAIVGPSGAGKSSLVGLLLGWLQPSSGHIRINGAPIDYECLRASVAWVDPAVQLWNRTLLSNLTYGSSRDPDAVGKMIDAASLRQVLETLPQGLQTTLGEGGGLVSGGEGQRVRLGRAMLRENTRLVILDEPFRGLDREKRRELLRRTREFWHDCTLLCITHDIEETRAFDRVIVIERGRIREIGRPEELARNRNSRYAELLDAEAQTHFGMWSKRLWRRVHVESGRLREETLESGVHAWPRTFAKRGVLDRDVANGKNVIVS